MLPDLERLIQLQRLETIILEGKAAIALHPQKLAALEARLDEAKHAVESAKEQLKANGDRRRELEKDVALYQGRLTKFKDQLSAVKTNREYTAMQHEIATAQSDLGAVEEKVLERMLEADEILAASKRAEATMAAQSKEIEAEKKTLNQDLVSTEASLKEATEGTRRAREGARAQARRPLRAGREGPQGCRDLQRHARRAVLGLPRAPEAARVSADPAERHDHPVRQLPARDVLGATASARRASGLSRLVT